MTWYLSSLAAVGQPISDGVISISPLVRFFFKCRQQLLQCLWLLRLEITSASEIVSMKAKLDNHPPTLLCETFLSIHYSHNHCQQRVHAALQELQHGYFIHTSLGTHARNILKG